MTADPSRSSSSASLLRIRAIVAASLAGLLFGFDTAVISGVTGALRQAYALSPGQLGLLVSTALWGTLAGALVSGRLGDRWGSLAILRVVGIVYVVSAIGCGIAAGPGALAAFRLLGGLAIGASSVLVPVYIAEISPARYRGLAVGLFQFAIVLGILAAYLSNFVIGAVAASAVAWRWKFVVAMVPAVLFVALLAGLPQSPRWLRTRGRGEAADHAAARLGMAGVDMQPVSVTQGRLRWSVHRRSILLAVAIGLFNQLSGINAILYYMNDIFVSAGFADVSADRQAVAIGVANLVATGAAMAVIDRVGRRPLLIAGAAVTAAALAGVAMVYSGMLSPAWLLPLLVTFIFAFAASQGAVIWVYLSEIFPADVRARGQAIGSATHWLANAVLSVLFPVLAAADRAAPFWFFAAAMVVQAVVVACWFVETRRRPLEDIAAELTMSRRRPVTGSAT